MKTSFWKWGALVAVAASVLINASAAWAGGAGGQIDICKQVSAGQLKELYRRHLYPTASDNDCFWSEKPGGMAEIDIRVVDADLPLRDYFAKSMPSGFKLVKITDLGDGGLMTVEEKGVIGIVVIRKGKRILQSSPGFLGVPLGSKKQVVLWDIYRGILKQM